MPATEATYYNVKRLHVIFGALSLGLLVAILWMIAADHMREWKRVQRDFLVLDARRIEAQLKAEQDKLDKQKLEELKRRRQEALQEIAQKQDEIAKLESELNHLEGALGLAREKRAITQSVRDSVASKLEIAKAEGRPQEEIEELRAELRELDRELRELRLKEEKAEQQVKAVEDKLAELRAALAEVEQEEKALLKEVNRLQQALESRQWGWDEMVRSWPILDAFASPVRIEQTAHDDLPLDFNFAPVPRFDRCVTCHKGIDSVQADGSPTYTVETIEKLGGKQSPYWRAFLTHPRPDLYVSANSPHPRETFGCTVCHSGQGSGTTFTYASHTPNSPKQRERWERSFDWHEVHFWEEPMLPRRFYESSCLKCHVHVVDLENHPKYGNPAPKLLRGYHLVRQYGCFGCHEINGYSEGKRIGPDMRLEPQTEEERQRAEANPNQPPGTMRKVGPSLRHIADKVTPDWVRKWIKLPRAFRPTTRMPQFYLLSNNDGETPGSEPDDLLRSDVEIYGITYYLFQNSEPLNLPDPPVPVDPTDEEQVARGREAFIEKGCLACHTHRAITSTIPRATADFGPDLSDLKLKLVDADGKPNVKWLFHWLKNPKKINPRGFMPELKLTDQEAADIAAWLLSQDAQWHETVSLEREESERLDQMIDDMIRTSLERSMSVVLAEKAVTEGLAEDELPPSGPERLLTAPISRHKKLMYIGQKTIGRLGCFGCHDIPGFENAKPIGTPLTDWGRKAFKDPEKLEFMHVAEFVEKQGPRGWSEEDHEYFLEGLKHHKGIAFLWQKLQFPRSFDYNRERLWDDKLRMPRFPFADNPEDVEAVMTFILGLVNDVYIASNRRALPDPVQFAKIEGWKAITRYNCAGCHVLQMPQVAFDATGVSAQGALSAHKEEFPEVIEAQRQMARDARVRENLYLAQALLIGDGVPPLSFPDPEQAEVYSLELWEPIKWGEDGVLLVGDRLVVNDPAAVKLEQSRPAIGGQFAEILVERLAEQTNQQYAQVWGFVPPPLVREGFKVQPAWLHQFLLDPFVIRPAARLRMPKFHMSDAEAAAIARYFAIVDRVEEPYDYVPEREEAYIRRREADRPGYFLQAWNLLTMRPRGDQQQNGQQARLCASCHRIGTVYPQGGTPEDMGPDLHKVATRLRSEYLWQWIASPRRLLPYTGMPANFSAVTPQFQDVFKGSSIDQVIAVKDVLLNFDYVAFDVVGEDGERASATGSGGE